MAKPSPRETFDLNMADAYLLVELAEALDNFRARRMRRELREKVGMAIGVPAAQWTAMDCIESEEFFLVLKPGSGWEREHLQDRSPLLRQAVVAGAAAFETFLTDRVVGRVREIMRSKDEFPPRLASIAMTVGNWRSIESYSYRWRGITEVVLRSHVREQASTASNQVGQLMSTIGVEQWARRVDSVRGVTRGTTVRELDEVTDRRNRIAHEADRRGHGRATIDAEWVRESLDHLEAIVKAVDSIV